MITKSKKKDLFYLLSNLKLQNHYLFRRFLSGVVYFILDSYSSTNFEPLIPENTSTFWSIWTNYIIVREA